MRLPVQAGRRTEIPSMDSTFLQRVSASIERHLGDERFTVESLARELGISRVHLHRRLTSLTGSSARKTITTMRLRRGRELLLRGAGSVSDIAYRVGFSSPSYFAKRFKDEFGLPPSALLRNREG